MFTHTAGGIKTMDDRCITLAMALPKYQRKNAAARKEV